MKASLLVPYTPGDIWRDSSFKWLLDTYKAKGMDWEVIVGESPEGPYSRTAAILDAAEQATTDLFIITDADVWVDPRLALLGALEHGWAVPHKLIHRLSPESTLKVLAGEDWKGLPLSTDNSQDRKPYVGKAAGTILVTTRKAFELAPPDSRFKGWGQEDDAWGLALTCLVGAPWRGTDDLVHLWHPPQQRSTRVVGTQENMSLLYRYKKAARNPVAMAALVAEPLLDSGL